MRSAACSLALVAALTACATQPAADRAAMALAGTQWELVAIRSMDDAQGTTRIAEPQRFTIGFAADGRAALRLDCNRGTAPWTAEPSRDGVSGRLAFGPLAATRALCPPPSADQRVARDFAYVRSYLFREGRLFMSLLADGGIYEWRPVTP